MKTYALDSILHVKNFAAEFLKDSPLLLYFAFYEPFHSWLFHVADEWNPILKFFFNILMLAYGLFRFVHIIKDYLSGKKPDNKGISI